MSETTCRTADDQGRFNFLVGTGNDVSGDKTVTHALTGIRTGPDGGVHSAGFTPNHHGDVTTTDVFAADQADLSSFGHGISRFDRGHHAAGLDHAKGDALNRVGG